MLDKLLLDAKNYQTYNLTGLLLEERTRFFSSMYYTNCYRLYDLYYLSSPSVFDSYSFLKALQEEFPTEIYLLVNRSTGSFENITSRDLSRVMALSEIPEFVTVIRLWYNVLVAREGLDFLVTLEEKGRVTRQTKTKKIKSRLVLEGDGFGVWGFAPILTNKNVFMSLGGKEMANFRVLDLGPILYKELIMDLGIDIDSYIEHRSNNKSMFVPSLTFKEEIEFLPELLSGEIATKGKYAELLERKIDYYTSSVELTEHLYSVRSGTNRVASVSNYLHHLLDSAYTKIDSYLSITLDQYKDKGYDLFVGIGLKVYVKKNTSYKLSDYIDRYTYGAKEWDVKSNHLVGSYAIDYVSGLPFVISERVKGLCGEYISKEDVKARGYTAVGRPFRLLSPTLCKEYDEKAVNKSLSCTVVHYGRDSWRTRGERNVYYYPICNVYYHSGCELSLYSKVPSSVPLSNLYLSEFKKENKLVYKNLTSLPALVAREFSTKELPNLKKETVNGKQFKLLVGLIVSEVLNARSQVYDSNDKEYCLLDFKKLDFAKPIQRSVLLMACSMADKYLEKKGVL